MATGDRFLLLTCLAIVVKSDRELLVKDARNRRAVRFTDEPDRSCFTYGHPSTLPKLGEHRSMEVRTVNRRQLRQAIDQCHQQFPQVPKSSDFDFIYPGTRWCGPGDVAFHYNDLGFHAQVDACCRAHDFCLDVIPPKSCKHGLCNVSPFTASHCDCDEQFRLCLANLQSGVSYAVGLLFFDVGAVPCFRPRVSDSQRDKCRETPNTGTRDKRHCDGADGSGATWEFVAAKSFKTAVEQSRSFGRSLTGTSDHALSQMLAKIGDVTTIVKSVVTSTWKSRRVGRGSE